MIILGYMVKANLGNLTRLWLERIMKSFGCNSVIAHL